MGGERSLDGVLPLWVAVLALEAVAVVGTAALFLATGRTTPGVAHGDGRGRGQLRDPGGAEGACPACLALGLVGGRTSLGPAAAGSPGGGA